MLFSASVEETKLDLFSQKTWPPELIPSTLFVLPSGLILAIVIVPLAMSSFNKDKFSIFSEVIKTGVSANPTTRPFLSNDSRTMVNWLPYVPGVIASKSSNLDPVIAPLATLTLVMALSSTLSVVIAPS